jgi:hypothetical protein
MFGLIVELVQGVLASNEDAISPHGLTKQDDSDDACVKRPCAVVAWVEWTGWSQMSRPEGR